MVQAATALLDVRRYDDMTIERRGSTELETLREVAERWNLQLLEEDIERLTSDHSVQIGFLGDFSSGKSTLINELTGVEDLMPTHLEPCTANSGQVVSTPDLEAPEYFRVDPNGEMTSISRPDFDDLACGRMDGRPLVRLPPRAGFPAGFMFLDTPGLSTLIKEHTEVTLGELPFVDAAVICVDIRKGGLTSTVTEFLKSPGIRHLKHRFLIALTFADQLSVTTRQEVAEKVAGTLSHTVDCSESEAAGRIVVVSAGPEAVDRNVSALRSAIQGVFENRKELLMAERQLRGASRLVPHAIALLDHARKGLVESDDDFASRKAEANDRSTRLDEELSEQRRQLNKSQDELRRDVRAMCDRFRPLFAEAADDPVKEKVSKEFHTALEQTVRNHLTKFGQDSIPQVVALDAEIQRVMKDIDKITDLAAAIATAAVTTAILPGTGAAASAGEAAGGAAIRHGAASAARKAARIGKTAMSSSASKTVLRKVLIAIHDLNPINAASDRFAVWLKDKMIDEPMEHIGMEISTQAARGIETYFESEVFQPLERERDEVQSMLKQLETDRRTNLTDRTAKVSRVETDIERLQKLAG